MSKNVKFASQIDAKTLADLKAYAEATDRSISGVLTDAVREFLDRMSVRSDFRKATEIVLKENQELLKRLAK